MTKIFIKAAGGKTAITLNGTLIECAVRFSISQEVKTSFPTVLIEMHPNDLEVEYEEEN